MSIMRSAGRVLAVAVLAIVAWEGYCVWRAEAHTARILAAVLARPQPVSLDVLSAERRAILLKVEDPGFYSHSGIDLSSPGQGMTTITQALVKLLYFDPFQPGFAKIEQSLIARFVLDRHLGKDQQLALFVNQAYFGEAAGQPVRGFDAASRAYFGKPFGELDNDEFIGLVGMLITPNLLRPDTHHAEYLERVARIKSLLAGRCQPRHLLDVRYEACASKG